MNKYLYQGKESINEPDLNIYDFHARGYDPAIGRTLQMDPHAENYLRMSPYSWVANNPLRFIDPDGRDIIGTDGKKVTYQMVNGNTVWSKNASHDVQKVGNALLRTESGSAQLNKAMNSSVKISITVIDQTVKTDRGFLGGTTKYGEVTKSRSSGEYKAGAAEISIFEGSIDKLLSGESGENELSEAGIGKEATIGVTAGHEIEHATNAENTDQVYKNRLEGKSFDVEAVPSRIHRSIIKEEKEKLRNGN